MQSASIPYMIHVHAVQAYGGALSPIVVRNERTRDGAPIVSPHLGQGEALVPPRAAYIYSVLAARYPRAYAPYPDELSFDCPLDARVRERRLDGHRLFAEPPLPLSPAS